MSCECNAGDGEESGAREGSSESGATSDLDKGNMWDDVAEREAWRHSVMEVCIPPLQAEWWSSGACSQVHLSDLLSNSFYIPKNSSCTVRNGLLWSDSMIIGPHIQTYKTYLLLWKLTLVYFIYLLFIEFLGFRQACCSACSDWMTVVLMTLVDLLQGKILAATAYSAALLESIGSNLLETLESPNAKPAPVKASKGGRRPKSAPQVRPNKANVWTIAQPKENGKASGKSLANGKSVNKEERPAQKEKKDSRSRPKSAEVHKNSKRKANTEPYSGSLRITRARAKWCPCLSVMLGHPMKKLETAYAHFSAVGAHIPSNREIAINLNQYEHVT